MNKTTPRLVRPTLASGVLGAVLLLLPGNADAASSLRFHGNGSGGVDRVKIAVDDPANADPGPPADIGATDFTIEFWMKAEAADNTAPAVSCGLNRNWRNGNVLFDRNRSGADRGFGVAIAGGVIVIGVSGDGTGDRTICGSANVLDGRWRHVAVERRVSDGRLFLFVDGALDHEVDGPNGDISYPDDGVPADPNDPFLVIGAEKTDTGAAYNGFLDEIRLSTTLRYSATFTPAHVPFGTDAQTAALYHLDEAAGTVAGDSSGAAGGPSNGALAVGGSPAGPEWSTTDVAPLGGLPAVMLTGLPGTLSSPMMATNANDGTSRLFVVEQPGTIRIYENGSLLSTPFLDIHTIVQCCGEQGLLSMAFHPNYASNGYFYVYYINNLVSPGDITIARYSVSADPNVADPTSAQILLVVPHPTNSNHNGGQLFFGPDDGYLYAGTGDGGAGGDPPNNAQNLDVMLGKLLRLDVDGTGHVPCGQSTPAPYAIPPTNPFVGSGHCEEVWAYGLRNPWRYSFDRTTHDLLIGDVGQELYEEIDFTLASSTGGENYGWRLMEGFHCYNPPTNCNDGSLTLPVLEEPHTAGWCAIIGGYRYRGTVIPGLVGTYLYSDNCLGDIYAGTEDGSGNWTAALLKANSLSTSGFGQDESGELYVCDLNGKVYRVDPSPYPAPMATSLSPSAVIAGDPAFTLTVNGTGLTYASVVRWNGADRPTTFVSATKLTAAIPSSDIGSAGSASVTVFTPAPGGGSSFPLTLNINLTFLDVPTSNFAYQYIQAIYNAGITGGCGTRLYCPDSGTTRAQMAVFLLKASQGSDYLPPACTGTLFDDVPCTGGIFDPWIEDLANRGITGGCQLSPPLYCPDGTVTRAQMSAFLLKAEHGSTYVPPVCTGLFGDVACPSLFADWIEQLSTEGITAGCGGGNYCPDSPVTRAQMAVFLTKTFNIPLP